MLETRIHNRYLLQSELGRGGMGVVYRAHDELLDRDVAVKVLWSSSIGSQGRARLLREAQAAAKLNHPNIINIFDAGDAADTADGFSYIIMELLDGESLYEHRPETIDEILHIVKQVCDALDHAHTHGIIHRDLKPENIIVTSKGVAKLTDFGLSRSITARISQEGTIVGTVYYLAPEQALRQEVDGRADLYALGVLMYELVTGRLPFTADDPLGVISQHLNAPPVPPSTYNDDLPPALEGLIMRLMSKRPEDRPPSARIVRDALDHIYDTEIDDLCLMPGLSPLDRLARGRLVGRQAEFQRIKNLWDEVLSAQGDENVLVIGGEPGVGKTPLIKEIRSLAQITGARAILAECYARGNAPYSPIIELLREVHPLPEGIPDLVMADLSILAPDLVTRPVPQIPTLSPISEQQRLFESLFSVIATLAERQPLVMILEDAQWADGNSLFLIRHLARRSRATRLKLMIVLSYRPSELDDNQKFKDVLVDLNQERLSATIELQPFTREQTRELLHAMFMEDISDSFLDSIYKVTDGNLFFIEEICKTLIEEGKLSCEGGQWNFGGIEQLSMPQSIRTALMMRVNRLPENAQDTLRLASVIGREFDYEVLRRACEQDDEDQLIEALELAQRAQLINLVHSAGHNGNGGATSSKKRLGERFGFVNALIPTTLREEISSLRRYRLHRRIAIALEAVSPDDLEALAFHYNQARDTEKARFYTIRAGDRARKLYANTEALRFYSEALDLTPDDHPDRFHILEARSRVYDLQAQRDLQRSDIEAMLELAEALDDDKMRCDALIALADLFLLTENLRSREPARRAVEIAHRLEDPIREGRALRSVGWGAWTRNDWHESISALEAAVMRFRQAGMLAQAAECLHMLSLSTGMQGLGEVTVSQRFAEEAIQLSRMAGDPRQEAISLRRLAIVAMDNRDYDKALTTAQEALTLHRELGDRNEECMALNAIGVILMWNGQLETARTHFLQSLELAKTIHTNIGIWIAYANLVYLVYIRQGQYESALSFADEQLARPDFQKDPFLAMNFRLSKADLLTRLGQYPEANLILKEASRIGDSFANAMTRASIRIRMAYNLAQMGWFTQAHSTLEEARQIADRTERPNDAANLLMNDAEIALREYEAGKLNQLARAAQQTEQAVQLLRGTNWILDLGMALQTAAWVALARNQYEKALEYSTESIDMMEQQPLLVDGYQYVHVLALWANDREEEANELLEKAYQRVMMVASLIKNEHYRRSWLEDVRINREIISEMA